MQTLAHLSQEHHLPGGGCILLARWTNSSVCCKADCLSANNPDQLLPNLHLEIIILLLNKHEGRKIRLDKSAFLG